MAALKSVIMVLCSNDHIQQLPCIELRLTNGLFIPLKAPIAPMHSHGQTNLAEQLPVIMGGKLHKDDNLDEGSCQPTVRVVSVILRLACIHEQRCCEEYEKDD